MNTFVEIPATKRSLARRKLIYGVGINDSEYIVCPRINGRMMTCPYYQSWQNMMERCHSDRCKAIHPTYINSTSIAEWRTFSKFKAWMTTQDWQGKELDKDLIVPGNKIYSPEHCIFLSKKLNSLLNDHARKRGVYPQGVTLNAKLGKYRSRCNVNGKEFHIGYYATEIEAELSYLKFKSDLIRNIAYEQEALSNKKIQEGLLRHANIFMDKAIAIEENLK